jgi:hypothetical protein
VTVQRIAHRLLAPLASLALVSQLVASAPHVAAASGPARHGAVEHRARVVVSQVKASAGPNAAADRGAALRLGHALKNDRAGAALKMIRTATPKAGRPLVSIAAAADPPVDANAWDGIRYTDTVGVEPPDPWIAVSPSHIVQSTNDRVRITTRSGTLVQSLPVRSLFALFPNENDTDPRILWDIVHNRWIGVLLSYPSDYSANYLNLAVSETSDPTGAWDIFSYQYLDNTPAPTLPDYPGIASSGDKVILTANEFTPALSYIGASVLVLRWSDLLTATSPQPIIWTFANPALFTIRPAQLLSASNDLYLIAADETDGSVEYAKISGTSFPSSYAPTFVDLAGSVAAFADPPAPRQADRPDVTAAWVDPRPTDAVWRAGHLWFVATAPVTFDAGATFNDGARLTELSTTTATPTVLQDVAFGQDGHDYFMPGVGVSKDGTAFVVYSHTTSGTHPSLEAVADPAGATYTWSAPLVIDSSDDSYNGARWGDFVGVATDPNGTAAVWQAGAVAASDNAWRTVVSRLVLDIVPPTLTTPVQSLIAGTTVGDQTVPVRTSWTATDAGSGIASSLVRIDEFGAGFETPGAVVAASSVTRAHSWSSYPQIGTYRYEVTATDGAGNDSATLLSAALTPNLYQQTTSVVYTGSWGTSGAAVYSGGSVRYSSHANASATFTATNARSIAFVTYRASNRGRVRIYVDNVYKGTFTITSSSIKARNVFYVANFSGGTHKIKLVVASGRVDVDAFIVLR